LPVDELGNLPLSSLFSGPLLAAVDASVQLQEETVELLRETGYDENGDLVTVGFDYLATEREADGGRRRVVKRLEVPLLLFDGGRRRVVKRLEVPLLLFLSLPNLEISRIEEEFSAKITQVEEEEGTRQSRDGGRPFRLNVRPAEQSTSFSEKTKSTFDLDVRMVAEVRNETRGVEILDRAVNNSTRERVDERKTAQLREREDRDEHDDRDEREEREREDRDGGR